MQTLKLNDAIIKNDSRCILYCRNGLKNQFEMKQKADDVFANKHVVVFCKNVLIDDTKKESAASGRRRIQFAALGLRETLSVSLRQSN